MNRGMLTIPQTQLAILLQTAATSPTLDQFSLRALQLAQQANQDPVSVEISEFGVESLLDALPMPQPQESAEITQLRQLLSQFLVKMRS